MLINTTRHGRLLVLTILWAVFIGNVYGAVNCRTLDSGTEIEKVFHSEQGKSLKNALAESGITLDVIYPGSFALMNPVMGLTLTIFNGYGEITKTAPVGANTGLYFPAGNGQYYLIAAGEGSYEPGIESDGFKRAYYTRAGELLWEDNGTERTSGGWVCVSPDGERVIYIKRGYGKEEPNVVFRDKSGNVVAELHIPYPGRRFGFTDDGEYFLLGEDLHSERTSGLGTTVLDKNGVIAFNMDPASMVSSNTWRGLGVLGGTGKYLYQNFTPVTRRYDEGGNPHGMDPISEVGGGIQVYDTSGRKLWEIIHAGSFVYYSAISKTGEYVALFRGFPVVECEVLKSDTGETVRSFEVKTEHRQRADISISDSGDLVCVSTAVTGNTEAKVYTKGVLTATFNADIAGYFFISRDDNFAVFSGDRTLVIYTIK
jgi:hypothetical protein